MQIDVLPDDVLLEIFDFYMSVNLLYGGKTETEAWQSLIHVCRRWRNLVFGSPRHLNLKLYCTSETPAKDRLGIWPALPLIIESTPTLSSSPDNIVTALGYSNRVCRATLAGWQLEKVLEAMHVPFPELTHLYLHPYDLTSPIIPDSFLGGSTPRLQFLDLDSVSFPGLPKLLLSATHLVDLYLYGIPHSGYFSPQEIVASLSLLSGLETFSLGFQSPRSCPQWERRSLLPPKRSTLPALTDFRFKGVTEYLEELVTRINIPQLGQMDITFFNQIDFDCPRLAQFIKCTPTLRALDEARVQFDDSATSVTLQSRSSKFPSGYLLIDVSCREPDWQLSSMEQVCNSSLRPLSTVEDLYFEHRYSEIVWKNEAIENTLWLELLLPFEAVKNLYLSKEFAPGIAAALQELVAGRIAEVLPGLQNIFVEELARSGPFQEKIGQLIIARQLSDRPITISVWDKDSNLGSR